MTGQLLALVQEHQCTQVVDKMTIVRLIDFNGISTSLGLFSAYRLGNRIHCAFTFTFLHSNYTKSLRLVLNESWKQHPTKQHLYGHQPSITKTIKVRRIRHLGYCWKSKDKHISDIYMWTPSYGLAKAGRPDWTLAQQLWANSRYSLTFYFFLFLIHGTVGFEYFLNWFIWHLYGTLTGISTPGRSGFASYSNQRVLLSFYAFGTLASLTNAV